MACLCEERRPGVARHASNFLSRRRKKVTKERATLLSATPSLRYGATWGARSRGAPWNSLCAARAARTTTASQLTKHARSDAHATPQPTRRRFAPQRSEGVADSRVAFSLVTFSWRDKRKLLRRRAHTPASALNLGMPLTRHTALGTQGECFKKHSYQRISH